MATEELTLVVNDAELKQSLTTIESIKQKQTRRITQAKGLSSIIYKARADARAAGINLEDLPTLNRDMRLIIGLVSPLRQASRLLFQARRAVRGAQLEREAAALKDIAPELAGQLATAAFVSKIAIAVWAVTTAVKMAERMEKMQQQMTQQRGAYETMVRTGLDLTHEEWALMDRERVGWATSWDAFVAKSKEDFFMAAEEFMRSQYVKYTVEIREPGIADPYVAEEDT